MPLSKDEHGLWQIEIAPLTAGLYQYKFIVDGGVDGERWLEDPSNGMKAPDNRGGLNSVLVIK
jgi:1,4-alpha-glucan branching enzyme